MNVKGPINIRDNQGKEVIMRFDSDLTSSGLFYTDSNGRETQTRRRNFRPTWTLSPITEPVSGNYYPVNSFIFIRDETLMGIGGGGGKLRQLTLVNDRSQGGSSIQDGSVELMLHRRLLRDDSRGVEEPLNEMGSNRQGLVVNGVVSLIFDTVSESVRVYRDLAHQVYNKPLVVFTPVSADSDTYAALKQLASFTGLGVEMPANLHMLTLAPLDTNTLLVRIEHFYALGEDQVLSQPVQVNLRDAFGQWLSVVRIEEMTLGANMPVDVLDNQRLVWNDYRPKQRKSNLVDRPFEFVYAFNPMQIRTFRLYY